MENKYICIHCESDKQLIWNKQSLNIGDNKDSCKDLSYYFCDDCGEVYNVALD